MTMKAPARVSGWTAFAGVVLFIAGWLNFFYGLAGVLNKDAVTVQGHGVIVGSFTAWGWIHLVLGAVMVLTVGGLYMGRTWARATAVGFATLNAIGQIGLITAFPLFSILLIVLDVLVIYHLTAAWEPGVADQP